MLVLWFRDVTLWDVTLCRALHQHVGHCFSLRAHSALQLSAEPAHFLLFCSDQAWALVNNVD